MAKSNRKKRSKRREEKRLAEEEAAMGSKVTCSTCGKVWPTRLDYLGDKVKCGKPSLCPLLANKDDNMRIPSLGFKKSVDQEKKVTSKITPCTIPDKYPVPPGEARYYLEVPKVLVMEMSYK